MVYLTCLNYTHCRYEQQIKILSTIAIGHITYHPLDEIIQKFKALIIIVALKVSRSFLALVI